MLRSLGGRDISFRRVWRDVGLVCKSEKCNGERKERCGAQSTRNVGVLWSVWSGSSLLVPAPFLQGSRDLQVRLPSTELHQKFIHGSTLLNQHSHG